MYRVIAFSLGLLVGAGVNTMPVRSANDSNRAATEAEVVGELLLSDVEQKGPGGDVCAIGGGALEFKMPTRADSGWIDSYRKLAPGNFWSYMVELSALRSALDDALVRTDDTACSSHGEGPQVQVVSP